MGRDEILDKLGWSEDRDTELEDKLLALEYGGLIEGTSSIYFSANGFDPDVEEWLHEHHVLTADMHSWGIKS